MVNYRRGKNVNKLDSYHIVNEEGKIIGRYRLKVTALNELRRLEELMGCKLEIEGVYALK